MVTLKLNKNIFRVVLALILAPGFFIVSHSTWADSGLYLGAAVGQSRVNDSDFDDDSKATKIMLGGKFNDYIGLEAAANDYGDYSDNGYSSDLTGMTLALVVYLPLTDSFEIFVKGGNLWWEDDVEVLGTFDDTLDGEEVFYGVGMNFNFTDTLTLRVEMERYKVELDQDEIGVGVDGSSDVDVASVGIVLNF